MRKNPFLDTFEWLTNPDWTTVLYWALLVASFAIARVNWRTDPAQRTPEAVTIWLVRLLIGSMWYQGSTWKLPLPVSGGIDYWLKQGGQVSAFQFLNDLVNNVLVPALPVLGPLIYLVELFLAVAFMLGIFTRFAALVGIGETLFLWLTLYRHEHEWPWTYMFIILLHVLFIVIAAGRYLGLDALLRRPGGLVARATGLPAAALRLAT
jgi:uncharacterized membrane protein YphA (DoxX/SURF4 family)